MKKETLYKYSNRRVQIILQSLRDLDSKVVAAEKAGITYHTMRNWYDNIPEFRQAVDDVLNEVQENIRGEAVSTIQKAFKNNWQSAAWFLERKFPEEFGKKEQIDQTMKIEQVKIKYILPEPENTNEIPTITFSEPKNIEGPNEKNV